MFGELSLDHMIFKDAISKVGWPSLQRKETKEIASYDICESMACKLPNIPVLVIVAF